MTERKGERGSRGGGRGGRGRTPRRAEEPGPVRAEDLDDKRYYRIGEVSRITGVKAYVLRYWESEFRWMAPAKSRSKQRLYRKKDIERILLIRQLLHEERYTIAGAKKRLRELGADGIEDEAKAVLEAEASKAPAGDAPAPAGEAAGQLALGLQGDLTPELQRIRKELEAIRALI